MAQRKVYLLDEVLVSKIEDYRFRARIGTESAAVRRLLESGLIAMGETKDEPDRNTDRERSGNAGDKR